MPKKNHPAKYENLSDMNVNAKGAMEPTDICIEFIRPIESGIILSGISLYNEGIAYKMENIPTAKRPSKIMDITISY